MIEGLKPYPAYKDSGVDWLGKVPAEWGVGRGKQLFLKADRPVRPEDEVVTCFRDGQVTLRSLRRVEGFTQAIEESGYQGIRRGDLVIHQMDAFAGAVGISESDGKGSPVLAVCVPQTAEVDVGYYKRVVRQMALGGWITALAKGIRERSTDFRFETFGRQVLPFPPVKEQVAIVRFLNHADQSIQRYIAAKERLIELLEEEKQAIIHRAVTRGLDPNVRLKPSGVDWLGDVPEHWEASRVKNEFACLNHRRRPLSSSERGEMQGEFDYYGASGVIDHVDDYLFEEDLLLIAEDGANLVLRNLQLAIVAEGRYWVNNHAHILRPQRGDLGYLAALMEAIDYRPYISGAAQPKLTKDRLLAIPLAMPSPDEQLATMRSIRNLAGPWNETIGQARRHASLLREYRTRLIADVVTGKLDVREAAANLPDDPAEDDPALDDAIEEAVA